MSSCNCPLPPGGHVSCEEGQMALCIVRDGKAKGKCITLPKRTNRLAYENWALSKITGRVRLPIQRLSLRDKAILESQSYETGRRQVSFHLPPFADSEMGPMAMS